MPGALEVNAGVEARADLKEGCGPAGGGGRGGRDACGCGVEDDEGCGEAFKPGGGGYDMMNGCAYTLEDAMRVRTGRVNDASAEGDADAKPSQICLWSIAIKSLNPLALQGEHGYWNSILARVDTPGNDLRPQGCKSCGWDVLAASTPLSAEGSPGLSLGLMREF